MLSYKFAAYFQNTFSLEHPCTAASDHATYNIIQVWKNTWNRKKYLLIFEN